MAERGQHILYQVSTATALVEGIYQGALDGEMVVVDGHFFQVRSDGSVREVQDNVLGPFAAVTAFCPDQSITLDNCPDLSYLTSQFDALRHPEALN